MRNYKICIPLSPGKRLGHEEIKVTEILISYGGGMGGASNTIYATEVIDDDEMFIVAKDFLGRTIDIGKRFIVRMQPKKLIREDYDTTMHPNVDLTHRYILMDKDDTYEILHTSTGGDDVKVIHTESENGSYFRKR